jgi:hypothetical protein
MEKRRLSGSRGVSMDTLEERPLCIAELGYRTRRIHHGRSYCPTNMR